MCVNKWWMAVFMAAWRTGARNIYGARCTSWCQKYVMVHTTTQYLLWHCAGHSGTIQHYGDLACLTVWRHTEPYHCQTRNILLMYDCQLTGCYRQITDLQSCLQFQFICCDRECICMNKSQIAYSCQKAWMANLTREEAQSGLKLPYLDDYIMLCGRSVTPMVGLMQNSAGYP